jgi:hypothetical protein
MQKKSIVIGAGCLALLVAGFFIYRYYTKPAPPPPRGIVLGLLMPNSSKGKLVLHDLLVFGHVVNHKFISLEQQEKENDSMQLGDRPGYYMLGRTFQVYNMGKQIAKTSIRKLKVASLDCEDLWCGKCSISIPNATLMKDIYIIPKEDEMPGSGVFYTNEPFLAVSMPKGRVIKPIAFSVYRLNEVQANNLRHYVAHSYPVPDNRNADSIQISKVYKMDIDKDGIPEYFTTAGYFNDTGIVGTDISSVIGFRIKGDEIQPFFTKTKGLEQGDGYYFIDAVDVDNDGSVELFFMDYDFEGAGIVVYSYKNGQMKQVLEATLFGC